MNPLNQLPIDPVRYGKDGPRLFLALAMLCGLSDEIDKANRQ
jgi:hypothetical protein